MSNTLHIQLLGGFKLTQGDQLIQGVDAPRLQSMLAYVLMCCRTPQLRQHIAFTFWPDASQSQVRNNLRQILHQLRQALPGAKHFIHASSTTVQLVAEAEGVPTVDVVAFEQAITRAAASKRRDDLEEAVALYSGDLLPDCYDDWIGPERERLQRMFTSALWQLTALLEQQRDVNHAIPYAKRLCELDPLDEGPVTVLMRLHALNNNPGAAQRIYQAYATALLRELGIEPSRDLRTLRERLLRADALAPEIALPSTIEIAAPLIGRQAAWELLHRAWEKAARGEARMALVSGEAGIGKTRLTEELVVWATKQGINVARTSAYATGDASGDGSAYAPLPGWLRSPFLRNHLTSLDTMWLSEIARILPELQVERPDIRPPVFTGDPSGRQRFFEALAQGVLVAGQPLLLVMDDMQWCDPETLTWLGYLLRFDASAKVLIAGTARLEEVDNKHPLRRMLLNLQARNQLVEIKLGRLDPGESAQLASHILNRPIEQGEATRLYQDSEGNPLFVIEMAQADEASDPDKRQLPPRVQAVLASRLVQVSDAACEVMGVAAAFGRVFSVDELVRASGAGEMGVLRSLDELCRRDIVWAQNVDALIYDFTHAKLREVAYAQLSPAKRRLLQRRVAQAQVIETTHATELEGVTLRRPVPYQPTPRPQLPSRPVLHQPRSRHRRVKD